MPVTLDRLKSQLLTSGLQQENFALFQVINQLIQYLSDAALTLESLTGSLPSGSSPVSLPSASFLTKNKEVGLPNSLQVLPGAGIEFNDVAGRRTILTAIPFGMDGEQGEEGVPGPPGRIGIDGIQGKDGIPMLAIDGEDGIDGDPGQPGATGGAGPVGAAGAPGIPGIDGIDAETCESLIPGPQGPPGLTGGNGGLVFWFDPTDASDIAGYKKALTSPSPNAESTITTVCAGVGDNAVATFVTEPGIPAAYWLEPGGMFRHIHTAVTTVGGFARMKVEMYYCNADGSGETLIGSSYSDPTTDTSIDEVNWDLYQITRLALLTTQRLVWKLFAARTGGPANVTVVNYFEGATHQSYVNATVSAGAVGPQGPMGQQGTIGPIAPALDPEPPDEPMMIPGPAGPSASPTFFTMKKTGNQTINGGAGVFVDITDLTFPVVNGVNYAFYFYIVFRSAATTTGWKASVNHPGGTVDHFVTDQTIANGAAGSASWLHKHNTAVDDMTLLTSTITAAVDLVFLIQGRYLCTANGTFAARFANELNANTDIVVQAGSWGFYF